MSSGGCLSDNKAFTSFPASCTSRFTRQIRWRTTLHQSSTSGASIRNLQTRYVLLLLEITLAEKLVQTRKKYEAEVQRVQTAREGLPPVATILGLDEMQVCLASGPQHASADGRVGSSREGDERQDEELL